MRTKNLTILSAAAFLLAGSASLSQTDQAVGVGPNREPQKPIALSPPKGTPKRPQGLKAMQISEKGVQGFSVEAVSAYFKTHNLPMNMGSMADIRVEKVEILTDSALAARLEGESTGIGADEKVALATLGGVFVFTGPPGSKPSRTNRAYAVFDTKTGNLLMAGTFGSATEKQ